MSATPEFVAEVATGYPAVPQPEYDQLVCILGCTHSGTYEPRPWGSSDDIATEYTSGPAACDGRHLVSRSNRGLLIQRVESTTPGSYDTIDNSAFTGTAVPAVVASVVPRNEGEGYIRIANGGTLGVDGITYYASDDNGRLGATELFRLGVSTRVTLAALNAAVEFDPPLAGLLTFVNELVDEFEDHIVLTTGTVHGAADTGPYTIGATAATQDAAIARFNQMLVAAKLHVVKISSSIHGAADTTAQTALNAITAPTTGQTLVTAALAFATAFFGDGATANSGHSLRTASSIHGIADATNVIVSDDPTRGTVLTGAIIRFPTFAPAWGNTQLAAAIAAYVASDHDASMLLISGRILPANMATISTGLNNIEADGGRCTVIAQARRRTDAETEAQWRAALTAEWADTLDYRVALCAGDGLASFTDGGLVWQYARGFSTQAVRRLMAIPRHQTAWEYELGPLEDFTTADANGILVGHDEKKSPGLKDAKFWTCYRGKQGDGSRATMLNFDVTRYASNSRVRSVRVNRITNRMILEIQAVGLGRLGKTYDVKRTSPTAGILSQKAIDALTPLFAQPIKNGFRNDISDWSEPDLIIIGSALTIDPGTDAFDLVVTINYTPKLPVGRVSAKFAVRLGV